MTSPGPADGGAATGSILLAGAGRMGQAMLEGWLATGIAGRSLTVVDPFASDDLKALCAAQDIGLNPPLDGRAPPDILVLAVKPQMLDAVAPALAPVVGPRTLLVSIIAGKTVGDLSARFPAARVLVRAMPNTPAAVGRGITGVASEGDITAAQRAAVDHLLRAVGQVEWLASEALIDAVTAVSGSGPAYVFYLTECLARAGEAAGLDAGLAARLARATVEGAGELMFRQPDLSPAVLRQNVTSPGGTTAAALDVLAAPDGLDLLVKRTVAAAQRRAHDLSG